MAYDEKVWAMLGSVGADSTHIALRGQPESRTADRQHRRHRSHNSGNHHPLVSDHHPGRSRPVYTLARRIYTELGLTEVALLRVNDRYGRFGVVKFRDAARRLGHPVIIEQKYMPGTLISSDRSESSQDSGAEAIVIWGDQAPAGGILKQMREMGMKQRVFGSFRTMGENMVAAPDPPPKVWRRCSLRSESRRSPWVDFQHAFR